MLSELDGFAPLVRVDRSDLDAIWRLAALCNAVDGLDLKISPALRTEESAWTADFAYVADGELVGYCSLDGELEVELCGMVHPDHRRQGIGRALLAKARSECVRRGARELLLICEEQSRAGQAFVATVGGAHRFDEHEMDLRIAADMPINTTPAPLDGLRFGLASRDDVMAIVAVTAAAFGDPIEQVTRRIERDLRDAPGSLFGVWLGAELVGTLKLYDDLPGKVGIYAVAVAPSWQGRGVGRWMMLQALEHARRQGHARFGLEVDPNNANAVALYRGLGFVFTTTYCYYELPLG